MLIVASIAMMATMTSCDGNEGTGGGEEPTAKELTASVTPSEITADGTSKAVFTVKYGDQPVSNVKAYVNGAETSLNNLTFTTKTAGTYKFYFTYEWTSGKTVKSNEVSVTAKASGDASGLTMEYDTNIIQVNEGRVTFTIKYNGKIVESGYSIYVNNTKTTLPTTEVDIEGKKYKLPYFESKTTGTFEFWVSYNITENTKDKIIYISVINDAIPDRVTDSLPNSTSFKHYATVMQFTGTECPACPYMIEPLEDLAADDNYKDKFTWAAIHTYDSSDPAKPCNSTVYTNLPLAYGVSNYPTVLVDIGNRIGAYTNVALNLANLKKAIDSSVAADAAAGISAAMTLDEANRVVTVRVSVKAKEKKVYRVGMWLLEDDIRGGQSGSSTINSHNNAVRYVARGKDNTFDYLGHVLNNGNPVNAGETVDYIYSIKIDNQSIALNKCQLFFFVTTSNGNSYTVVNSAVSKDLSTAIPFAYK